MEIGPEWSTYFGPIRKSVRADPTEDPTHATLCLASDRKEIGMMIGTAPDCRPHIDSSTPTFE
jgi:hypothetical protein